LLDYYKILGIHHNASQDAIKRAYHERAKVFHPDVNKANESMDKFHIIANAYEVLIDTEKRRKYDRILQLTYKKTFEKNKLRKQHPDSKYHNQFAKLKHEGAINVKPATPKKERQVIIFENVLFGSLFLIGAAAIYFAANDLMSDSFKERERGLIGLLFGITFIGLLLIGWKLVLDRKFTINSKGAK